MGIYGPSQAESEFLGSLVIKPCPFCGSSANLDYELVDDNSQTHFFVSCSKCQGRMEGDYSHSSSVLQNRENILETVNDWNKRTYHRTNYTQF